MRIKQWAARVERSPVYQYGMLAVVVLLAAALRFYRLGDWSFWIDEVFTVNAAPYIADWPVLRVPLALILTNWAMNWGEANEWSARFFHALVGVITIPLIFFPVRRLFDPWVALITALLLAVSPWHLFWSQNARFYPLLLLFYTLGLLYLLIGLLEKRGLILAGAGVLLLLAIREKTSGLIFVPGVAGYVIALQLLFPESRRRLRPRQIAFILGPLLLFLLYEGASQLFTGRSDIQAVLLIFGGQVNHSPVRLLASIVWRIGLATVILGGVAGLYFSLQKRRAGLFIFLAAIAPMITLVAAAPFFFTVDRYAFVSLPFWLILCALAIKTMWDRAEGWDWLWPTGVLLLLLALSMGENWLYYSDQNGGRPQWREALHYVSGRMGPDEAVYVTWPEIGRYYLYEDVGYVNDFDAAALPDHPVWFVLDEATGWVDGLVQQWLDEHAQLQQIFIVRLPGKSQDIRIYLYKP
ncbi:MAG: glycosyltransferase family 39 protein [Anaerolineae bacterium]|nr:glycosyltransferase family 39 protein [Anaerolineae bacterium]